MVVAILICIQPFARVHKKKISKSTVLVFSAIMVVFIFNYLRRNFYIKNSDNGKLINNHSCLVIFKLQDADVM